MTRRDFMKWMAASVALSSAACSGPPVEPIYPYVDMPEGMVPGEPIYYATQWLREGYAQGVLVSTQMGRPVKVEGNPQHPAALGGTDVFAQAAVLQLWDPDRSQQVMQAGARLGSPGTASPSTWPAFEAAWRERSASLSKGGGPGLRILTGPVTSPSMLDGIQRLMKQYPAARWHRHAAVEENASGILRVGGKVLQVVPRFSRATCVVAFDCDPFAMGPGHLRHARDWSDARRAGKAQQLFAVESCPSSFGAVAQHRLALPPHEIDALIARLAVEPGASQTGISEVEASLRRALAAAPGASLLLGGPQLSPAARQSLHALNQRLGNVGRTLDYVEALDASLQYAEGLPQLIEDMRAGQVDSLLIIGGNPVYDTAAEAGFATALARVPFSAHLSLYVDETSRQCSWHVPEKHAFEAWGDARAYDGTAGIVQPAIAPLYDGRSATELLAMLGDDTLRDDHGLVQRFWRQRAGEQGFEQFWQTSLRNGFIADSAAQPTPPPAISALAAAGAGRGVADGSVMASFVADPAVGDGSFANLGWLQELPRPVSKLTWDNAALIAPETAKKLQLADGDVVRISRAGHSVEAPVLTLPLHAEGCVTLPLGYGREHAGRVGDGVGFNAYLLRPRDGMPAPVQIERTDKRHEFAITQREVSMHDRDIVRTVAQREPPREAKPPLPSLYPEPKRGDYAWAMSIDLDACIGCSTCTVACQAENNIPVVGKEQVRHGREMHWIRVDRYIARTREKTPRDLLLFQPIPCMHCEDAPCEAVCPVGATVHDSEGLNVQVYNRCVGTRFCSNNCPYKVRRFNFLAYTDYEAESLKALQNPDVTVRRRGVMEKCSYCVQRISRARINVQRSGEPMKDGDVVTACEAACPTRAIVFGDINDPQSRVSKARASGRHYLLLEELNTRPRTAYLARVVTPVNDAEGGA